MDNTYKNENNLIKHCERALKILAAYYNFNSIPNIQNFLLAPSETPHCDGQVLFEECENEFFIGIQFAKEIHTRVQQNTLLSAHHVSVIAEELSHFKFLADVVDKETQTNLLTIETLGEIDRFLCVMHWNESLHNSENDTSKINVKWKNIHQICDTVFTGDRFQKGDKKLYIEAENLAFKHLKEAFADKWDCSYYNFSAISKPARNYLTDLRMKFLA